MNKKFVKDKSLSGTLLTDELHSDLGSAAISLFDTVENTGHFFMRGGMVIRTAASGGGTLLEEGTDYILSNELQSFSDEVSAALGSTVHIYRTVQITNVTYQSGNLYFTYYGHGDAVKASTINRITPYVQSLNSTQSVTLYGLNYIFATRGATGIILTLADTSASVGDKVTIDVVDSAAGCCLVKSASGKTFASMNQLFLMEQYQKIELMYDGSNWQILSGVLYWITAKNTNDWTNRELGMSYVPWDNPSGTLPVVGEKVTESTSGITAIVVAITGTTSGYITMMYESGLGIFTDNRTLTGSWGGGYVTVNIPGSSSKNADTSIIHNTGRNMFRISHEVYTYAGTTFQWTGAYQAGDISSDGTGLRNIERIQVDTNTFKLQTAAGGVTVMDESGALVNYAANDYSFCVVCRMVF